MAVGLWIKFRSLVGLAPYATTGYRSAVMARDNSASAGVADHGHKHNRLNRIHSAPQNKKRKFMGTSPGQVSRFVDRSGPNVIQSSCLLWLLCSYTLDPFVRSNVTQRHTRAHTTHRSA